MRGALVLLLVATPLSVAAAPSGRRATKPKPATTPATAPASKTGGDYLPPPTAAVAPVSGTTTHKEGDYGGVNPGEAPSSEKPAKPKHLPAKGTLTWIGFEAKDGGAEVFFQSVAPFTVSQRVEGSTLVVHLDLPRLGHNTWRQVDTRFFDNPLSGIVARAVGAARAAKDRPAHGAGVEARVSFKNPKDAREGAIHTKTEADGMYYAYLTFGEGTEPSGKPTAPVMTPTLDEPEAAPAAPVEAPAPAKPTGPQKQEGDTEAPPER